MRLLLSCASISLLALSAATATQEPEHRDACHFRVSESTTKPTITGPDDVVALTHVVEQPDSPVEILAIDFKNSFVSLTRESYTEQLQCTARIRNRSDQWIRGFEVRVYVAAEEGITGAGTAGLRNRRESLAPCHEMEIQGCGSRGSGGAHNGRVRIVAFVSAIATDDCAYLPSLRYPNELGVVAVR
jgi:hypothetical protein